MSLEKVASIAGIAGAIIAGLTYLNIRPSAEPPEEHLTSTQHSDTRKESAKHLDHHRRQAFETRDSKKCWYHLVYGQRLPRNQRLCE